ncbi:hypothetical protein VPH35_002104 [Triticum aestivum]
MDVSINHVESMMEGYEVTDSGRLWLVSPPPRAKLLRWSSPAAALLCCGRLRARPACLHRIACAPAVPKPSPSSTPWPASGLLRRLELPCSSTATAATLAAPPASPDRVEPPSRSP